MSKKKLAFYDAFRQKPDDANEQPTDVVSQDSSTSSKNLSGYSAYTPGEELTIRPRPKHIPTSHHSVGGQNIEVRAKGSSLAPGLAQKYQTPNVNKDYLPTDGGSQRTNPNLTSAPKNIPPMPPTEPVESIPAPSAESHKPYETRAKPVPKVTLYVPENEENVETAKPISSHSTTMPYLQPEDLETQNIQIPTAKKTVNTKPASTNEVLSNEAVFTLTIPQAFAYMFGGLFLMCISFYMGISFHKENNSNGSMHLPQKPAEIDVVKETSLPTEHKKIAQPIEPPVVEQIKPITNVEIPKKGIIIRACTVENLDRAKLLAQKLESNGIKPTELKQTRRGVLILVGPFETSSEATKVLKSIKFQSIQGWKPFEEAYIVNN